MPQRDHEIESMLREPMSAVEQSALCRIQTALLPLGPVRNLTTLLGAVISLHPEMVTLNHAACRILDFHELDFLHHPDTATFDRFLGVAIRLLQSGEMGARGGSILKSHAFDDPAMKELYRKRFGERLLKQHGQVLYWKDPKRIKNHLFGHEGAVQRLVDQLPSVKFLLPIRNPIDCAKSSIRTGHWKQLVYDNLPSFGSVLRSILRDINSVITCASLSDQNLLLIWEDEMLDEGLSKLCRFVNLDVDAMWSEDVRTIRIRSKKASMAEREIFAEILAEEIDRESYVFKRLAELAGIDRK